MLICIFAPNYCLLPKTLKRNFLLFSWKMEKEEEFFFKQNEKFCEWEIYFAERIQLFRLPFPTQTLWFCECEGWISASQMIHSAMTTMNDLMMPSLRLDAFVSYFSNLSLLISSSIMFLMLFLFYVFKKFFIVPQNFVYSLHKRYCYYYFDASKIWSMATFSSEMKEFFQYYSRSNWANTWEFCWLYSATSNKINFGIMLKFNLIHTHTTHFMFTSNEFFVYNKKNPLRFALSLGFECLAHNDQVYDDEKS
jgi:hypothetical protein